MQPLTGDDKERVQQWVKDHVSGGLRCFLCGLAQFTLLEVAAITALHDIHTGRINYMDGYPLIGLMCTNCAHVVWFSARAMGFEVQPPEGPATAQQEGESQEPTDAAEQAPA